MRVFEWADRPRPCAPALLSAEPLALSCYGKAEVHEAELRGVLHPGVGPVFAGLAVTLPDNGHRRADGDDRVLLTKTAGGPVRAFANLCPHALRPLVDHDEPVTTACITCPFHGWSFRRDGSLIGGRDFEFAGPAGAALALSGPPHKEALGLHEFDVLIWNGLVWMGSAEELTRLSCDLENLSDAFAERGLGSWLDFASLTLVFSEQETYSGDWKTFVEVYGDCYHVPAYHGGLSSYADCQTLAWSFGVGYHAQFVQLSAKRGGASAKYSAWVDGLDAYYASRGEVRPDLAVAWTSIYPNVMVEVYNGVVVVSVIVPDGPNHYHNRVHFLFPSDLESRVPGLSATIKAAYDETAAEDRILNESRAKGLATARSLGLNRPTYVANLAGPAPEAGTQHFQQWWRHRVSPTL